MTDEPAPPYVAVLRVEPTGQLKGLDAHAGRDVLVVRIPGLERERIDAWEKRMEDDAANLAKRLDLDPERARTLVRDTVHGAEEAAKGALDAVNKLASRAYVEAEAADEKKAVEDVAVAARRGAADWAPNRADRAEALRGKWQPGAGGP